MRTLHALRQKTLSQPSQSLQMLSLLCPGQLHQWDSLLPFLFPSHQSTLLFVLSLAWPCIPHLPSSFFLLWVQACQCPLACPPQLPTWPYLPCSLGQASSFSSWLFSFFLGCFFFRMFWNFPNPSRAKMDTVWRARALEPNTSSCYPSSISLLCDLRQVT